MGGVFNHINLNLYHYAGNNPVRYTDPDGREAKQHTELHGRERFYKEFSDIFGCDIKEGVAGSLEFSLLGFAKLKIEINVGTFEVTQEKGEIYAKDTTSVTATLSVFNKAELTIGKRWTTDASDSDKMSDHIINAWKNGQVEDPTAGAISIKGPVSLAADKDGTSDIKLGAGIMLGVGLDVWINVTEAWDFIKYLWNGDTDDDN